MNHATTRRQFLHRAAATAALSTTTLGGVHAFTTQTPTKLRFGLIGCGGIMQLHLGGLLGRDDVSIAWLCDVDPRQLDRSQKAVSERSSQEPRRTERYEDVLDDDAVDAVVIATPHHWHAPIALRAIEAGKHVYVEKPLSHVYSEGPLLIAAAKKHGRMVQQGSQMRSSPVTKQAEKLLRDGIIGDIKVARAWTAEVRNPVSPVSDSDPPSGVDYDRWLGPAPQRPFNSQRFHGSWRMFRDYANGEIGDDGIHDLDMAAWGLDLQTLPKQITARGGHMLSQPSAGDYPDNMNVTYEYPDGRLLIYENYPFTAYGMHGFDNGNVFYGTTGYMIFSRRGAFSVFLGPKETKGPTEEKEIRGQRGYEEHMTNFLDAIRHGTPLNASPEIAHRSCALVHFGDIAEQTSGRLDFDPDRECFVDNDRANELLTKEYREPYRLV